MFELNFPAKSINNAPENNRNQPGFSFTVPAAIFCHDLNGRKLKKSTDLNFTAISVKTKTISKKTDAT